MPKATGATWKISRGWCYAEFGSKFRPYNGYRTCLFKDKINGNDNGTMGCQDGSCNGKQCGNNSGNEQEKVDCPFDTCNIGYCYKGCVSAGCTKKRCPADGKKQGNNSGNE